MPFITCKPRSTTSWSLLPAWTGWPCQSAERRDDIISKSTHYRTIKETFPNLATFILEEIQPYQRGQFLLWELSELDRIDKHRLIEPVVETLDKFSELALQAIERF